MPLTIRQWIDQPTWDHFIGSQRTCHFNQGWAWGEAGKTMGGELTRLVVTDGDEIKAAMSIIANPIRHTSRKQLLVSRGPIVDNPTEEIFQLLLTALGDVASDQNALVAKLEPHVPAGDHEWVRLLHRLGYSPMHPPSQPRSTWVLDLQPELDTLLANMKSKWRYNIRLAERKGVEIISGFDGDVTEFYRLYAETARRDGFFIHTPEIYTAMFDNFEALGQFELMIAKYHGQPISAASLVQLGPIVWYLNGASTNRHRDVMAPQLVQWEAIKWARARGATLYDFRGAPDVLTPDQDLYSVYRFKQGFGGRHVTFLETFARGYQRPLFDVWKAYWQGRFYALSARRRFQGLPQRQWT